MISSCTVRHSMSKTDCAGMIHNIISHTSYKLTAIPYHGDIRGGFVLLLSLRFSLHQSARIPMKSEIKRKRKVALYDYDGGPYFTVRTDSRTPARVHYLRTRSFI